MVNSKLHLEEAERHVHDAEAQVAKQGKVLDDLARDGHDTKEAKELLGTFQKVLAVMKEHHQFLVSKQQARHRSGGKRLPKASGEKATPNPRGGKLRPD